MSEDESYIVKKRDLAEIIHSRDSAALTEFLRDPRSVIAGALIEGFSRGPSAFTQPLIRVGVAALTGRALEQFAKEIKDFRDKGNIPDDWAEKPKGYQTWVELLRAIDEENPDEERLDALKAMFFAVNRINAADAERIFAYQLFQIAKKLNSNELLVLKAVYKMFKDGRLLKIREGLSGWWRIVAGELKYGAPDLVQLADKALVEYQLFTPQGLGSNPESSATGRLTELGMAFCENVQRYQIEKKS
jgi:hypothetical protein